MPSSPPLPPQADDESGLTITVLPGGAGLRLAGDADMASLDQLRAAVAGLPADSSAIHLELSGLRFIDVAGARTLMSVSQPAPGRRLVLHDPPAALRRILGLLWPASGVEIRLTARPPANGRSHRSG